MKCAFIRQIRWRLKASSTPQQPQGPWRHLSPEAGRLIGCGTPGSALQEATGGGALLQLTPGWPQRAGTTSRLDVQAVRAPDRGRQAGQAQAIVVDIAGAATSEFPCLPSHLPGKEAIQPARR